MQIADHAHNPAGVMGVGVEFLRGLDETERQCKSIHCLLSLSQMRVFMKSDLNSIISVQNNA